MRWGVRWERTLERAAAVAKTIGKLAHRLTRGASPEPLSYIALSKLSRSFHRRGPIRSRPEVFLLEVYNPEAREVHLQVIFSVSVDDLPSGANYVPPSAPVTKTVVLPPGYSRHHFESASFQKILDQGFPFKITMVPEADMNARLVFLMADLVTFKAAGSKLQEHARGSARVKLVVWHL